MKVHRHIEQIPFINKAVITIGNFDGVHLGHQKIIAALKEEAKRINGQTVIITFDPHPRKVLNKDHSLQLINTLDERISLLANLQIDHVVLISFTKEFAEQTADDYINNFLINKFHPHSIIIGYDHRFGKGRVGNFSLLEEKASVYKYQLIEIPKHVIEEIGISSSKIRTALLNSDVDTANRLLGYQFFFEGRVVTGDAIGRAIGYPTANLNYTDEDKIRLGHGVYAVYVDINGEQKKGMLSIGTRPTIDNNLVEKVEVNVFDFNDDLYHQTLRITVKKFLRHQVKYNTLTELTRQLDLDKENSLCVL